MCFRELPLLPLTTQQCAVVIIAVDVDTETLEVKCLACLAQGHTNRND